MATEMAAAAANRPGVFITIVDESDTFPWQFTDPNTNQKADSLFTLRVIPESVKEALTKRHMKVDWRRGQRQERTDWTAYSQDAIDYALVAWQGVMGAHRGPDGGMVRIDLPCERKYKLALPENVKAEIIRLCVGREAGEAIDATEAEDEDKGRGVGNADLDPTRR